MPGLSVCWTSPQNGQTYKYVAANRLVAVSSETNNAIFICVWVAG